MYYIQKNLVYILNHFVALENAGIIEHYYKIKKGIVVIATHLETLLTE